VPAKRSRTEHWRRSLEQIAQRDGSLEISLPSFFDGAPPEERSGRTDLVWRVRIVDLNDREIVVEQPSTLGQPIRFVDGVELVGVIAVGQNRWMFKTRKHGDLEAALNRSKTIQCMRLEMPTRVERCQRRSFYRVSTLGLFLPRVQAWPVLQPSSVAHAETACRARLAMFDEGEIVGRIGAPESPALPVVGPPATATLVNIGGGGAGLLFEPGSGADLDRRRLFWLHLMFESDSPAPLGVAAKLAHTHRDSEQRIYAGFAFDFAPDAQHKRFVVDRIVRYVAETQREQLRRLAEERSVV